MKSQPTETADQKKRRDAIAEIQDKSWHTRYQLVQVLKERYGIDTTDGTVKDDLAARGLKKPKKPK
jgi:arginine repressor